MSRFKLVAGLIAAAMLASGCETYFDYQTNSPSGGELLASGACEALDVISCW